MEIKKEDFVNKLEEVAKKFYGKLEILTKDISDVILFLSVYCGESAVDVSQVQIQMKGLYHPKILGSNFNKDGSEKKAKREGDVGFVYRVASYDQTFFVSVVMGKRYLKIEKKSQDESNLFFAEYIFAENGEFVRTARQKSSPLGKQIELEEISNGSLKRDVVLSSIKNKSENLKTEFFKAETKQGAEVFYSYTLDGEINFCYRTKEKNIPSITSIGMKDLNMMFEKQFEDNFEKIEETFFRAVQKQVKDLFEKENQ